MVLVRRAGAKRAHLSYHIAFNHRRHQADGRIGHGS
jgi:hypothetical protein